MWRFDGLIKQRRVAAGQQATGAGLPAAMAAGRWACAG